MDPAQKRKRSARVVQVERVTQVTGVHGSCRSSSLRSGGKAGRMGILSHENDKVLTMECLRDAWITGWIAE